MRLLCLAALTFCATSAAAQPTLAPDRAPAVPSEVRPFVERLYSAEANVRAEAACQLRKQHRDATAAIPILLSMLSDDVMVPAIECHMTQWLRRQLPISADARKWSETSPAKEAAETLGDIGDAAVPGLLEALRHADWRTRKFAAYGLGEAEPHFEQSKVIAALSDRLSDEHAEVRDRSAWALGEIEEPAAVPALIRALQRDGDRQVRATAAWALGEIEDPSAVQGLVSVLNDSDLEIRRKAAWALGEIEDTSAIAGLVSALKDADVSVRKEAARALGEIEGTAAVPALVDALKDSDWHVRKMAAWALGEIEDASALNALQAARYDANVEVRRAVMDAIRELRER